MSQSGVLDYVEGRIELISSYPSGTLRCMQGIPKDGLPADLAQYPLVVISARNIDTTRLTPGVAGTIQKNYAVVITLHLAPKDVAQDVVVARSKLFPDRFAAMFASDNHLGGNCFDCDLRGPADNFTVNVTSGLPDYQETGAYPILQWALMVTELTAANAAAS